MRNERDYYVILQVDPRAEHEIIEAAYRRLAVKYHPDRDRSPEANVRMSLINAAYEVLSDPVKRRDYDLRRTNVADRQWSPPQLDPLKGRSWWPIAITLGLAAITLIGRSPTLLLFLVVVISLAFVLWSIGRSRRG